MPTRLEIMSLKADNLPAFNSSIPDGGDPRNVDVNLQYVGFEFHYTYLIFCGFIVWLIIPGIGLLYGGMARRKSALSLLVQSLLITSMTTFQWIFWGFSLAYSRTAGKFIGDLENFGMRNVVAAPSVGSAVIPDIVFCLYQMMFAACTIQIVVGGSFERGRLLPSLIFGFCWLTVVYCPIACWTWNPNGWLYKLPSLDFAGGGPVHISSGWSGLAYAAVLGKRKAAGDKKVEKKAHNVTLVFLGTVLIWFGWFGFNGGSALNATVRAMYAAFNTNTAASSGVLGWCLVDFIRRRGRFSIVGACEGAIAGLVGITPAAGFVSIWPAALIGFVTAIVCALMENVNDWIGIDDGLEVFKLHAIGGMVGSFMTGIFAQSSISALDGISSYPGGIDGNGAQIGRQFAEIGAISAYSFVVTGVLLFILNFVPGMRLRISEEAEPNGLDFDQLFDEQIGDWSLPEDSRKFLLVEGKPSGNQSDDARELVISEEESGKERLGS